MCQEYSRSEEEVQIEAANLHGAFARAAPQPEETITMSRLGLGRYFVPDPVKSGVEHYRLRESGYSVWTIIGALREADGNVHEVAETHAIPETQVHACIGLLLRHPLPILGRIADEEDPEVVPTRGD